MELRRRRCGVLHVLLLVLLPVILSVILKPPLIVHIIHLNGVIGVVVLPSLMRTLRIHDLCVAPVVVL
jgi:hypothetical protein